MSVYSSVMAALQAASAAGVLDTSRQAAYQTVSGARSAQAQAPGMPRIARVYASELLDTNTCKSCAAIDGKQYTSVDEAHQEYRTHGGYMGCQGGLRCRGSLVFVFDTETPSTGTPPTPTPPQPAGPMNMDDVYDATSRVDYDGWSDADGDSWLAALYERQGFNALPARTVDPDGVTMYRGLLGGTSDETARYVDDFVNGPTHFPGCGIAGNGSYATTSREAALTYSEGDPNGVVKMVLSSDARVIDSSDAARLAKQWQEQVNRGRAAAQDAQDWDAVEKWDHLLRVVQDPGRVAVMEGYDAIRWADAVGWNPGRGREIYYVVLNRGKVGVQ